MTADDTRPSCGGDTTREARRDWGTFVFWVVMAAIILAAGVLR